MIVKSTLPQIPISTKERQNSYIHLQGTNYYLKFASQPAHRVSMLINNA